MRARLARFFRFKSRIVGLLITVMFVLLFVVDSGDKKRFLLAPFFQRLERLAYDFRFTLRKPQLPGPEVAIAAIDEKSIDKLGRWPWPYDVQAKLVDRLVDYGARVIGYDVVFSESDTSAGIENLLDIKAKLAANGHESDSEINTFMEDRIAKADHDKIFADALKGSARTVLGYFFHWMESKSNVLHLSEDDMKRSFEDMSSSQNSRYKSRIMPGVSLQTLKLPSAWAVESSIPQLSKTAWGNGFFNSRNDEDGVIRYYPLIAQYRDNLDENHLFAPLGIRVLERYLYDSDRKASTIISIGSDRKVQVSILANGRPKYKIPTDDQGRMLINYLGPSELQPSEREPEDTSLERRFRFPHYSVVDIVEEDRQDAATPDAFRDKIVLVGATATALADLFVTPVDPLFPGVETHATVIDNILRQRFLVKPWWEPLYTMGIIVVVGMLLILWLPHLGARWGITSAVVLFTGSFVLNYRLFADHGWSLNIVYPLLTTFFVYAGMTLYHYVIEEKDKRFLNNTFRQYLSPELIDEMVENKTPPQLGGSSGIRTAYFTDIASFSSFSEVLSATQLVELLNEYLTAMTDVLLAEGGTLDKYEGDAIVAFFGAPVPMDDHAARALRTALGMQQALARLRDKWNTEADKSELVKQMRMRIGVNSGDIVTGNMGSKTRMNYTMMGDVVNTAARLEASAKQYGIYIQCTTETLKLAGPDDFEWRTIDKVRVMGKTEPVETVEIMARKGELSEDQTLMCELYHQGLELYRQQKWDEAMAKFAESETLEEVFPKRPTTPSRVYLERCDYFKANPPGESWDGVWTLTEK